MQADSVSPTTTALQHPRDVWAEHYAKPSGFRSWPNEELVRAVGGKHFERVLEVGCGNGANLWFLAEHADFVLGVDGCVEAVIAADSYMRARGVDNRVAVTHGDIHELVSSDGYFDALVDVMVSQHVPWSLHRALYQGYRRVVKPGAFLFLYHLAHGTTRTGSRQIETFTYDQLPAVFPGVSPVCLPQAPALNETLSWAGFHPTSTRQLSRTYADGSVTVYLVTEAKAV